METYLLIQASCYLSVRTPPILARGRKHKCTSKNRICYTVRPPYILARGQSGWGLFLFSTQILALPRMKDVDCLSSFFQILQKTLTTLSKVDIISSVNNNRSKGRHEIGETFFCLFLALLQYGEETV